MTINFLFLKEGMIWSAYQLISQWMDQSVHPFILMNALSLFGRINKKMVAGYLGKGYGRLRAGDGSHFLYIHT